MVDQASATMRMKAMLGNEDEQLWPGDFVNARVSLKVLRGALTVPSAAIQTGPDGIFAWVVAEGDVVEARPITSGPTTDGHTVITLGLTEATVSSSAELARTKRGALVHAELPVRPVLDGDLAGALIDLGGWRATTAGRFRARRP
jgi:membrane fusion protein, multidrug efflux system